MKVLILTNEITAEAPLDEQDNLVEAAAIGKALAMLGHAPETAACALNLASVRDLLRDRHPDVVFNIVESVEGTGRLIHLAPSLLDYMGIPYTGARTEAMFISSNKLVMKQLLQASGITTPAWLDPAGHRGPEEFIPGKYIVKSVWEHASIGLDADSVVTVSRPEELRAVCRRQQAKLGGACFAEQYIPGREFNIAVLSRNPSEKVVRALPRTLPESTRIRVRAGYCQQRSGKRVPLDSPRIGAAGGTIGDNLCDSQSSAAIVPPAAPFLRGQGGIMLPCGVRGSALTPLQMGSNRNGAEPQILPPAEIIFKDYGERLQMVDYRAKWDADAFEYNHTPRTFTFPPADSALLGRLRSIVVQCWRLSSFRGYARVDFRVADDGTPYVLEVNANPCLSTDAGYAAALEAAGIAYPEAIQRILNNALEA